MTIRFAAPAVLAAITAFALAPVAHADDLMYRVGSDISPGDYTYTVVGGDWGSWKLCPDANCTDPTDMDVIDGAGHHGYVTVTPGTKFLKTTNLRLAAG
jgi:hypothetical protein